MKLEQFPSHQGTKLGPHYRSERYVSRDALIASLVQRLVICIWTPPVYAYDSREALRGSEQDRHIIRNIGLNEHVVGFVMAIVDTCRNGCLFSCVDDFREYNIRDGEAEEQWKAIG